MGVLLVQDLPQLPDVGGGADKAGGNVVKALPDAEEDVLPVPLAHIGHGQPDAGDVDALVVFHDAAVFHMAADIRVGGVQDRHAHQSVVQQNGVAGLHVAGQIVIGDGAARLVAHHLPGGQRELRIGLEFHGAVREGLQPDLRPLGVQHGGNGQIQLLAQGLQRVQSGLVAFMGAVGKIETSHVHARQRHLPQDALSIRGGAQRAHDFRLSHRYKPPFSKVIVFQRSLF